jgi:hypothetical protein
LRAVASSVVVLVVVVLSVLSVVLCGRAMVTTRLGWCRGSLVRFQYRAHL